MNRIHTTSGLLGYAATPVIKSIRNWWLGVLASHYDMCADVEAEREREARQNIAHYQLKAALARSNRI